jgi:hypothetical protein
LEQREMGGISLRFDWSVSRPGSNNTPPYL